MRMCGAMVVFALIVVLATGNGFAFLPVIGCVLMMVVVMMRMSGMGGRGDDHPDRK